MSDLDWLHWTLIGSTLWFWWKSFQWQREELRRCEEIEVLLREGGSQQ